MAAQIQAQQIRVYGQAVSGGKPLTGVMIMVFERHTFYKKFITDKKGDFRFIIGNKDYYILFYKPGMKPEAYHVINNMETDLLRIPIYKEMIPSGQSADSDLVHSPLLSEADPDVARTYIAAVYEYERSRRNDTSAARTRSTLMRKAIEERDRFATYRKTTERTDTNDSTGKVTITIGPDRYDMLTDAKGAKRYYKNQKPITEATYTFEATRRYEGVLKNKRDVRRFEKYRPMEHVKGK